MKFLVFRLYAPLASWGGAAVGEMRPSDLRPTRSALLGLLGAALGVRRDQDDRLAELADGLRFGVRVDSIGTPLTDYQTVQTRPPKRGLLWATRKDQLGPVRADWSAIQSWRDHRCDVAYSVVCWQAAGAGEPSLDRLAEALVEPAFVLFLGRKACPTAFPLQPRVVEAASIVEALTVSSDPGWRELLVALRATPNSLYWEGDESLAGLGAPEQVEVSERRDQPVSRRDWTFATRMEYRAPWPVEGD